jgi:septum formation protein
MLRKAVIIHYVLLSRTKRKWFVRNSREKRERYGCVGRAKPGAECVRILHVNRPVLVLASNSPRRRELLKLGGWKFDTRAVEVDESPRPGEAPGKYVLRLAESKAHACLRQPCNERRKGYRRYRRGGSNQADQVVLAADTAVVDGEAILGKPKDPAEAVAMLQNLRGHKHQVQTGIAVLRPADGCLVTDLCVTEVPMRAYRDVEIEAYVASGDPLDKAGAYAIQNANFHPVESLGGCYASVMGLPLCHLTRSLRKLDMAPTTDIAAECQSALGYACPISSAVLRGEMVG